MTNDEKALFLLKNYKSMVEEMKTMDERSEEFQYASQCKKMIESALVSMQRKKYMYNVGKIEGMHEDVVKSLYCDVFYLAFICDKITKAPQISAIIQKKYNIELPTAKISKIRKNIAHICGKYFFKFDLTNFLD